MIEEARADIRPLEIRVDGLHKAFDSNRVLCGVDLAISRGELVAIVGGSGCGKTVLLEHMIGHLLPDAGRVFVANHSQSGAPLVDINQIDREQLDALRTHWSIVFQRNALFSGTVYENLAMWLREIKGKSDEEIEPIAKQALRRVGFTHVDELLMIDRDDLSGGMAKRVAVARALTMEPRIMFYDEPTTGLDPTHAQQIHNLIERTHNEELSDGENKTTVIVTHDKDLLYRLQPRIVMLHEGRVFFDGTYPEFKNSDSPIIHPYFDLMPALQQRRLPE